MKMRRWLYHRSTAFFVFPLPTSKFRLMATTQPVAKPFLRRLSDALPVKSNVERKVSRDTRDISL